MSSGAVISIASSNSLPVCVDAATVSTHGALLGEPIVSRFGPSLPAATTDSTPASSAFKSARSSGA